MTTAKKPTTPKKPADTQPATPSKPAAKTIPKTKSPVTRIPATEPPVAPHTMTPKRLGGLVQSMLAGDTIRAACGSAAVAIPTYQRWTAQGATAINQARALTGEDDMEGALWQVIEDHGGHQSGSPTAPYWTAPPPKWWPKSLADRWLHAVLVILVYWARGQSERVYRQLVTQAATGGDWKAAEFMLTHSYGWSRMDRLEVTGDGGGPVMVQGDEDATLGVLALLAERRKAIEK